MFGSETLEVAIGLIFVYLLLSLVATAVREAIESYMKTRATDLFRGIKELLRGGDMAEALYRHPLVNGLYSGSFQAPARDAGLAPSRTNLPSYIPSANFALALLDLAARPTSGGEEMTGPDAPLLTLDRVRESVGNIPSADLRRVLLTAVDRADGDFARAQANLEAWYDSGMDRVSGWYKRRTQFILLLIGLAVTLLVNANSIVIARHLYENDAARTATVAQAEVFHAALKEQGAVPARVDTALQRRVFNNLDSLRIAGLPIGWNGSWPGWKVKHQPDWNGYWGRTFWEYVLVPVVGWLATALAISLGAPFWFDMLNKIMVIRSTVKPNEKSPPESSEDRQKPGAAPPPHLGGAPALGVAGRTSSEPDLDPGSFKPHEWEQGEAEEGIL